MFTAEEILHCQSATLFAFIAFRIEAAFVVCRSKKQFLISRKKIIFPAAAIALINSASLPFLVVPSLTLRLSSQMVVIIGIFSHDIGS